MAAYMSPLSGEYDSPVASIECTSPYAGSPHAIDGTLDPARDSVLGSALVRQSLDSPGNINVMQEVQLSEVQVGEMAGTNWAILSDQMNNFIKEITSIRGDIRSIRVATHRGFQDLELRFQKHSQDVMQSVQAETTERIAENERLAEQLSSVRRCGEGMEKVDSTDVTDEPTQHVVSDEATRRLEALQEELRTLTLETDRRLASFQQEIKQEATNREVTGTQFAQQLFELTEAIEKQAGLAALDAEQAAPRDMETQGKGGQVEMASITHQLKDLRLCLEAEVGARSAITERLHREVHDLRSGLDVEKAERSSSTKVSKESMQDMTQALQSRMQTLEASCDEVQNLREELLSRKEVDDKIQMMLDKQSQQRGTIGNLDLELIRDGLNTLEKQAKKHVSWVESQAEKNAVRQEALEERILQEGKARQTLDVELRQYLVNELSTQAKFFQGELKGLLASAHSSWLDENRKLWNALGHEGGIAAGAELSRDSSGKQAMASKKDLIDKQRDLIDSSAITSSAPATMMTPTVPQQQSVGNYESRSVHASPMPSRPDSSARAPAEGYLLGKNAVASAFKSLNIGQQSLHQHQSGAIKVTPRTNEGESPMRRHPGALGAPHPSASSLRPEATAGSVSPMADANHHLAGPSRDREAARTAGKPSGLTASSGTSRPVRMSQNPQIPVAVPGSIDPRNRGGSSVIAGAGGSSPQEAAAARGYEDGRNAAKTL